MILQEVSLVVWERTQLTDLVHPSIGDDVLTSRALLMENQESESTLRTGYTRAGDDRSSLHVTIFSTFWTRSNWGRNCTGTLASWNQVNLLLTCSTLERVNLRKS